MAQGEFTKEEAKFTADTFKEVFEALPKSKQMAYIGHANDIYLFLSAAEKAAPHDTKVAGEQQATAQVCQPQKDAASTH